MVRLNAEGRAFHAKIQKTLEPLSVFKPDSGFFVYVISDPRTASKTRGADVMPFYVGQTSDMGRRAKKHLADGGSAEAKSPIYRRVYEILQQQMIPRFTVVETVVTRLAALEAERKWALKLNAEGYCLLNEWAEHRVRPLKSYADGTSVPTMRLWGMTVIEAKDSGIRLAIQCRRCKTALDLPMEHVCKRCRPVTSLLDLKSAISCPNCGTQQCLEIVR
jgi:hypothetical protein